MLIHKLLVTEPFYVQLLDKSYLIQPQKNKTFKIIDDGKNIGAIYPIVGDLGEEWKTSGELEEGFAAQIGELINVHNM